MKAYFLFLLVLSSQLWSSTRLPGVIELDRYLVEARRLIDERDFTRALTWLGKAEQLQLALPPEFHYLKGRSLLASNRHQAALDSLVTYLNHTGRTGDFYKEALMMITAAEKQTPTLKKETTQETTQNKTDSPLPKKPQPVATAPKPTAVTAPTPATDTLKRQRQRAATYQPVQDKINQLLSSNAIYERHGIDRPTLVYSIRADYGATLVVIRSEDGMEGLERTSYNLAINQIPDRVTADCSWLEQRCWISHPLKPQRWLEINYNEAARDLLVTELESLVRLIRLTQAAETSL